MTTKEIIAKSVVIGRKPRQKEGQFKTAFLKVYDCKEPLVSDVFPLQEIDIPNIQKVVFHNQPLCYYLEGNDLVFNDINKVTYTVEEHVMRVYIE